MKPRQDLTGKTFSNLYVSSYFKERRINGRLFHWWRCVCSCGKERVVISASLISGHTKSCGHTRGSSVRKVIGKHLKTKSKEHGIWVGMRGRCFSKTNASYKNYGARGIVVDSRWSEFKNFYSDMGNCPDGLTLGRIDNNGPYSKENCRWETRAQQSRNTRRNIVVTINGEKLVLADAAIKIGIRDSVVRTRKAKGWDTMRALVTPVKTPIAKIEFAGEKKTITQWAKKVGIAPVNIKRRLARGWPIERALTLGRIGPRGLKKTSGVVQNARLGPK